MSPDVEFECIPAIDLKGGKCVRLQEGAADRSTEYGSDPVAMALFWERQGATRLHVVDLDGAFGGSAPHLDTVRTILRSLSIPVQFGGGLRTLDHIARILELGADRAILGTVAAENPGLAGEASRLWPGRIVAGLDARNGKIAVRGWLQQTAVPAVDLARELRARGIGRFVYTDVSRDGMLAGVNLAETESLARDADVRVIASGGVSSVEDVRQLWLRRAAGIEGVVLGRALYEGRIVFRDLQERLTSWAGN